MLIQVARRLAAAFPVMGMVALIVFLLLHLTPGDPAAVMAGDQATLQDIESIRRRLGLDRPLYEQFGLWVWSLLRGDLGTSLYSNLPVAQLIGQRLEPTLLLTVMTMVIAILLAVPIGMLAAWKAGSLIDRCVMALGVFGFSVPIFVVGYALIYVFSINLGWFPVQGYRSLEQGGLWPALHSLVMPSFALGLVYIALVARITRASVLEVLSEDFIRTARAKGVGTGRLLMVHALRNAAVPIVTVIGIGFALVISGVVVTETVFNIPGLGRMVVDAILNRDYPVIQAMIMLFSGTYVVINVLIDVAYCLLDPRIRY